MTHRLIQGAGLLVALYVAIILGVGLSGVTLKLTVYPTIHYVDDLGRVFADMLVVGGILGFGPTVTVSILGMATHRRWSA